MKNDQTDLTRGWIRKAESDLADVRRTLLSEGPFDTACFHCQQAAEKYLKAFLAWHGRQILRTHDIEELLLICAEIDHTLNSLQVSPEELSGYAVEIRYDAEFWPEKKVAEDALTQAEKIRTAIRERLPTTVFE